MEGNLPLEQLDDPLGFMDLHHTLGHSHGGDNGNESLEHALQHDDLLGEDFSALIQSAVLPVPEHMAARTEHVAAGTDHVAASTEHANAGTELVEAQLAALESGAELGTVEGRRRRGVRRAARAAEERMQQHVAAVGDAVEAEDDPPAEEEVYCFCRKPDDGRLMIACDECNEWYHVDCLGLNQKHVRALAATSTPYVCHPCRSSEWAFFWSFDLRL